MPELFLKNLKNTIKYEWKLAFCTSFIFGILTHIYIFVNRFPNHDGLLNLHSKQAMVKSGRFFLGPASSMSSYFDLPIVIGVLSIFYLALAAICITMIFDLKKKIAVVLVSGIVVSFPSISATFSYIFTADGYFLGLLMSLLAVALTKRYKYGFLLGAVLLCLAVGIYQANLSIALTFLTLWVIHEILFASSTCKENWIKLAKSVLMVGIGMVAYLIVYKISTSIFAVKISSYQGLDKVGSVSMSSFSEQVTKIHEELKMFFFRGFLFPHDEPNLLEYLNVIVFIALVMSMIAVIWKNRVYKNVGNLATFVLLVASLPISYYIAYFLSPDVSYHMLMVFSLSSVYIFLAILFDRVDELKPFVVDRITSWASVVVLAITIVNFAIIANIQYFNMELRHEKSINFANRIVTRMEMLPNYHSVEKMVIYGNPNVYSTLTSEKIPAKIPKMTGAMGEIIFHKNYHYQFFINTFLGLPLNPISFDEFYEIQESDEYKEMGIWPAPDSVKVIGNVAVVKLQDGKVEY